MILSTSSGEEVVNANDKQIREALSVLDIGGDGVGWAILARSETTYIQASGDKNVDFELEYQEGTVDEHFRAKDKPITLDDVVNAFIAYRNGSTNWQDKFDFERIS